MGQRQHPNLAEKDKCTACLACVSACSRNALRKALDKDGHYQIILDENSCVQCRRCENVCPILNGTDSWTNDFSLSTAYKGWNNDAEGRNRGTSGGVFEALGREIIRRGGIVVGAYLHNNSCRHIVVEKAGDLHLLQGSKYIYSDLTDIYDKISIALKNSRTVLFSGLPCQVAGVRSYFKTNKKKDLLYTVDLVCGGVPSEILKQSFLTLHPCIEILSFRTKNKYELKCIREGKTINMGKRNPMILGFLSGLTNRQSCYDCKFARAHRGSDITLGDYWQSNVDDGKGISLILAHSKKGEDLLSASDVDKLHTEWENFLPYNPKIVVGKIPWGKRWERQYLSFIYKRCPAYIQNLIYSSVYSKFDIFGLMYLAYKKFRGTIEHKRRLNEVEKIIQQNHNIFASK